jgi:hypothetical protein
VLRQVIYVLKDGRRLGRPFLDIRGRVDHDGTERGLLYIACQDGPVYRLVEK